MLPTPLRLPVPPPVITTSHKKSGRPKAAREV